METILVDLQKRDPTWSYYPAVSFPLESLWVIQYGMKQTVYHPHLAAFQPWSDVKCGQVVPSTPRDPDGLLPLVQAEIVESMSSWSYDTNWKW